MTDSAIPAMEMPPPAPPASPERLQEALPRRRFFSDMPDKGLFGGVAAVGFTIICMLKLYSAHTDLITVFAVVLMVVYGTVAYRMPQVQMRLDRLGDNFYYLGFIYTLASLTAALMQLRGGIETKELIGSFGVALVTTIVGITGRVMFTQLRGEIDDVEERVRRDLVAASADLRAQLSASVREFETFRIGLLQTLEETNNAAAKARERQEQQIASETQAAVERLNAASADLHAQLSDSLREFEGFRTKVSRAGKKQVEDIEALVSASTERIEVVFNACDVQNRRTSDIMNTIASTAENMTKRFIETDLPGERLSMQLKEFVNNLEEALRRVVEHAETSATRSASMARGWNWPFRS